MHSFNKYFQELLLTAVFVNMYLLKIQTFYFLCVLSKKRSTRIWLYNYVHTFKLINITIPLIFSILQVLTWNSGQAQKTLSNHRNIDFTTCTYYKNFYYTRQYCLPKVIFVYQQISFPLRIFLDTIYSANFHSFRAISAIVNGITSMNG